MFTGLIETTGAVLSLTPTEGATRLIVSSPALAGRWKTGDSIAVNGVCLTALPVDDPKHFAADLAEETIQRTTLTRLKPGSVVNLELPTPAGSPLGGHVVQGHVDGTATLVSLLPIHPEDPGQTDWRLTIAVPRELASQVIPQGSITVDGISLTIAKMTEEAEGPRVEIAIIPHTYQATNLHALTPGSQVNLETDVLAKYAARQASKQPEWLTTAYLLANGY